MGSRIISRISSKAPISTIKFSALTISSFVLLAVSPLALLISYAALCRALTVLFSPPSEDLPALLSTAPKALLGFTTTSGLTVVIGNGLALKLLSCMTPTLCEPARDTAGGAGAARDAVLMRPNFGLIGTVESLLLTLGTP